MSSNILKMRNKIILAVALLLAFAVSLSAHPLGNFTVNNFSRIDVEKTRIKVRAILDMAEIPAFQESQQIDADGNKMISDAELGAYLEKLTPEYAGNLRLFVNEQPVQIQVASKNIFLPMGNGNLPTLRMEWDFVAEFPMDSSDAVHRLRFENANYKERVGWNEIVVSRAAGVQVFDSTAFGNAVTDELKTYPDDMLSVPLAERAAEFSFTTATVVPANAKILLNRNGNVSVPMQKDKFAELIAVPEITPTIALFGLLLAFGLGAMHAMSPGHGKTVVGAYLVGSRGTIKHAIFLGATVTITHTLGVFVLGLITLFASNYVLPEKIMPFLSFVSGLLVFFIGVTLFKDRLFGVLGWKTSSGHHHIDHSQLHDTHSHRHSHDAFTHTHDGHTHSHLPPEDVSWRSLLGLGISGGLLPCPSALVLMLSAINLGRIGYGLILILVFSLGLAATLTAVGLIFLYGGKALGGSTRLAENRLIKTVPVISAFVITCVGAVICYNSLI